MVGVGIGLLVSGLALVVGAGIYMGRNMKRMVLGSLPQTPAVVERRPGEPLSEYLNRSADASHEEAARLSGAVRNGIGKHLFGLIAGLAGGALALTGIVLAIIGAIQGS